MMNWRWRGERDRSIQQGQAYLGMVVAGDDGLAPYGPGVAALIIQDVPETPPCGYCTPASRYPSSPCGSAEQTETAQIYPSPAPGGEGGGNQIRVQPLRRLALPGQLAVARPGCGCHGPQLGRVSLRFLDQHLH